MSCSTVSSTASSVVMSSLADSVFRHKYAHTLSDGTKEGWEDVAARVAYNVVQPYVRDAAYETYRLILERKFMPGGRYLYAAGRRYHQTNNCALLRAYDSREGWAELAARATNALMTGMGIGVVYGDVRPRGSSVGGLGGEATGPCALMQILNETGRHIKQGGSRRCLPADTQVTMGDLTKKKIVDVRVGDEVMTRFGPRKVTNVFDQGEQEILRIETRYGPVVSSANHRWLSANTARTKTFSVPADKLSLSHKLYYHPTATPGGDDLEPQIAYTLGFYLGNGCAYTSGNTSEVTLQVAKPKHNHEQVKYLCDGMRLLGAANPVVRRGHGEVTEIRCRGVELVPVFQQWKEPHRAFAIPEIIRNGSLEARYAFIAGWFDADGYYGTDSWKLANKHAMVRQRLLEFLNALGFVVTLNGMELRLCSYQHTLWRQKVLPYAFKRPVGRVFEKSTSEIPSEILAVSKAGKSHTYDIEVEDVHEFIADGFVSHNSAIWAGLPWSHPDVWEFIRLKNWPDWMAQAKLRDFNASATMDGTNISVCLDDAFFHAYHAPSHPAHTTAHRVFRSVVEQMCRNGEPGFSIDVGRNAGENLRNACTEVCSRDDEDVCNLASLVISRFDSLDEFRSAVEVATTFLLCGTLYSDLPTARMAAVREKNRRLGLGLMGLHEWLLRRGKRYGPDNELAEWLGVYRDVSDATARKVCDRLSISPSIAKRAIAPTGTISIIAETTSGIEPVFAVAFKRRYLKGDAWHAQYVIEAAAERLIRDGIDPDRIEDAYSLAADPGRRLGFQAFVQQYVDQGISSTLNLPEWGTELNNPNTIDRFADVLMDYLPKLRGVTAYPDGSRGGQPLTVVPYREAVNKLGVEVVEYGNETACPGGVCGV